MDPYYTPVQVDSYLQKCESTRSIFEFLTLHTDYQTNNRTPLALSATEFVEKSEDDYPSMAIFSNYSHSYVLQLPPLKTHSNPPDILNSDYQPSTASTSVAHQAQQDFTATTDYFNAQDDPNTSYWHTRRHVACLNLLFDGKQHFDSKNSSYSHSTSSNNSNEVNQKDSEYDLDSLILDELEIGNSEADNASDVTQDDCIMLTFPPTADHSCGDDSLTTVEPKAEESGNTEQLTENHTTIEEHLAESNLTINPHHFDPL